MRNLRKKKTKKSGVVVKKITSAKDHKKNQMNYSIRSLLNPSGIVNDTLMLEPIDVEPTELNDKEREKEEDREAIKIVQQTTRVNWPTIEGILLEIGSRPQKVETHTVIARLVAIAQESLTTGQFKEAKIIMESLVQLQSIEAKA